jgi:hypothetical protein
MFATNANLLRRSAARTSDVQQSAMQIYDALAQHQKTERAWEYRECLVMLHAWAKTFVFEFKLGIPAVAIGIERLGRNRLGQFRRGHNSLGLQGEILIDEEHLRENASDECWWRVLGTLFHELLHGWQQTHGKDSRSNYHNKQFRRKAADYGLLVSENGVTDYEPESPFFDLLRRHGVIVPRLPEPVRFQRRMESSKLKLWMCGCPVRVRVAVPDFMARCEKCGNRFELVGPLTMVRAARSGLSPK